MTPRLHPELSCHLRRDVSTYQCHMPLYMFLSLAILLATYTMTQAVVALASWTPGGRCLEAFKVIFNSATSWISSTFFSGCMTDLRFTQMRHKPQSADFYASDRLPDLFSVRQSFVRFPSVNGFQSFFIDGLLISHVVVLWHSRCWRVVILMDSMLTSFGREADYIGALPFKIVSKLRCWSYRFMCIYIYPTIVIVFLRIYIRGFLRGSQIRDTLQIWVFKVFTKTTWCKALG